MAEAAAAAAAKAQQMMDCEEEELSKYNNEELNEEWEFKIVRSVTGVFKNPAKLADLIEREKKYGWVMLEKFDNNRIRFKRKRCQSGKVSLDENPYNTVYGIGHVSFSILLFFGISSFVGLVMFIVFTFLD